MLWWPRTDLWPAAENVITSIVNISEEELPMFSDPGCIWGGGGPSASWEMSPLRCSHWYRPDHSHPGGGDNYNEPHKIVSHHDTKTRSCIRAILVYNNSSLSIALVISSPIISVLHPMYHHNPWSVWRVSQDTLWMNHCLPLSVNLRHNNCLEREREHYYNTAPASGVSSHSAIHCLWFHAGCLHSSLLRSKSKSAFQRRLLSRTCKLDNWWTQRKNINVGKIVVFVNFMLQHSRQGSEMSFEFLV